MTFCRGGQASNKRNYHRLYNGIISLLADVGSYPTYIKQYSRILVGTVLYCSVINLIEKYYLDVTPIDFLLHLAQRVECWLG